MPKKIPVQDRRKWLQDYEKGKSEAAIANNAHRDLKAVKRGIEWARNERDASVARAELLKDALHNHQEKLLAIIDAILSALVLPPPDLPLYREKDGSTVPLNLIGTTVNYHEDKGLVITLSDEDTISWELLRDHLKRDRMWSLINQWKKSMINHIKAGTALKLKTKMLLETKTDCRAVSEPIKSPFLYSQNTVDMVYKVAIERAMGLPSSINLGELLFADPDNKLVKYGPGTLFAENVEDAEKCKAGIIDTLEELQTTLEIKRFKETYENLKVPISKARRAVEEISLLRLVPGRCRVCRRLGI
jgi:hypothetical protein